MSLHRRNPRRDQNEPEIVQALEAVGAEVWQVSGRGLPDLLVRFRGRLYAGEVKTKQGRLRATQGAFPIWRTPDEALDAIGAPLHICRQPGYDSSLHRCLGCQS